jgi:uncharacterized membrane protein YbhN (UPF0104 family)
VEAASGLKQWIKPAAGLVLVLALLTQLQLSELRRVLESAQWSWAVLALILAVLANLACALRWKAIVVELGQPLTSSSAIVLYFQGVTANTVLPGGIIGGDVWRTLGLSRLGMARVAAAQSVLLDRASGLWSLSFLALGAFLILQATGQSLAISAPAALPILYGAGILMMSISPLVLWRISPKLLQAALSSAAISVLSQALTIVAFCCCLLAVQAQFSLLLVVLICAGIFLAAVIPASIGGFGSRELASVFSLTAIGVQAEAAFLGSVLLGLTATAQGLLSLPSWLQRERDR